MTPVEISVRQAEHADLISVLRIERACFDDPWTYDAFQRFLGEPGFLVAERGGIDRDEFGGTDRDEFGGPDREGIVDGEREVVGFAIADATPNVGRDIGHLKDLAVHPDARGRGIGRMLLRTTLARLHGMGVAVVKLEVRESNEVARSLYATEGFEPIRRVPRYYRDGEDALVLVVDLAEWSAGR